MQIKISSINGRVSLQRCYLTPKGFLQWWSLHLWGYGEFPTSAQTYWRHNGATSKLWTNGQDQEFVLGLKEKRFPPPLTFWFFLFSCYHVDPSCSFLLPHSLLLSLHHDAAGFIRRRRCEINRPSRGVALRLSWSLLFKPWYLGSHAS